MWRAHGNTNPCTHPNEILQAHLHLSKAGVGARLTPAPSPLEPGGLETL